MGAVASAQAAESAQAKAAQTGAPKPGASSPLPAGPVVAEATPSATSSAIPATTLRDQSVADAADEHRRLASAAPAGLHSVHIARPDVSKMLAFRPALDIVGRKRGKANAQA